MAKSDVDVRKNGRGPANSEKPETLNKTETANGITITYFGEKVTTPEDLLRSAKIDSAIWEVSKVTVNHWGVGGKLKRGQDEKGRWLPETLWQQGLKQIRLELRRKAPRGIQEGIRELLKEVNASGRRHVTPKPPASAKKAEYVAELGLHDVHLGKLCWGLETGTKQDTRIQEQVYASAVSEGLSKISNFRINQIIMPVGSDFFQVDNWTNTTTAGTQVDHDGRFPKVFAIGVRAVKAAIFQCLQIAPVRVVWVPGNHDQATSFYLCLALQEFFAGSKSKDVVFDVGPSPRKYVEFGANLLGLTHGNEEKTYELPNIMAAERPAAWGRTRFREWRIGHQHHKKRWITKDVEEFQGVRVSICPSLSGTDTWHHRKGYIGQQRCAEFHLWHLEDGHSGHFTIPVRGVT